MKDKILNTFWGMGAKLANKAQRQGLLGTPLRSLFRTIGHLIIPAPSEETAIALPFGMNMLVPSGFRGMRSYVTGAYEEDLTVLFKKILNDGMTIVDLGSLLGYYTLLGSILVGNHGHIYSFEPEPISYSYLLKNIEINNCKNVTSVQKAVSNATGSASFITSKSLSIGPIGGVLSESTLSKNSELVTTTALDDFFSDQGWPNVDLIKMDIDGAETAALEGMREFNRRNPRLQLIMEFDRERLVSANCNQTSLIEILLSLGFHKGYIIERKLKSFLTASGFPTGPSHYNVLFKKTT